MAKSQSAMFSVLGILMPIFAGLGILAAQSAQQLPEPASPGKAIQDAAQASALYRRSTEPAHPGTGPIEVLSDTHGVDFGPYLNNLLTIVRGNWYALIPAYARTKKGKLAIEFAVLNNGHIGAMKLVATSGDTSLDRAAWIGITKSDPFPPLPAAYKDNQLALRFRFYYNPDKADFVSEGISSKLPDPIVHAELIKTISDSNPPKYPKKARNDKVEGMIRLRALIGPDGSVRSIESLEGNPVLLDAASKAIRTWKFQPAQRSSDSKPVEDHVVIKVEFRLDGGQVRAQVVLPEPASAPGRPE